MKNLCFIDFNISAVGGIERVLTSLCNELCKDYNVHIVSITGDYKKCIYNINKNIKCFNIGCNSNERVRNIILKSFGCLKDYISKNNIDIVFMIGHYVPPIALPVKPFVKSKFVFCDHGALINQLDDKKAILFRKLGSKLSDKTIVLTERTMNDYQNILNIKKEKIDYIYNWLDDDIIKNSVDYNIDSNKILSCGRFGQEKGYDILIDVAKIVFERHPSWEWHIYGNGEKLEDVKNMIYNNNLQNNVMLMGVSNNMYDIYKDYSIFALTSYREGLPLVLLEAKANRLPIISFDCATGPSEIIQDNLDGYLIECYNKDEMANKICNMIEDRELRKRFSDNSIKNLDKFSKEIICKKWNNLIRSL